MIEIHHQPTRLRQAFEAWIAKADNVPVGSVEDCWRAFLTGYGLAKIETVEGLDIAIAALKGEAPAQISRR